MESRKRICRKQGSSIQSFGQISPTSHQPSHRKTSKEVCITSRAVVLIQQFSMSQSEGSIQVKQTACTSKESDLRGTESISFVEKSLWKSGVLDFRQKNSPSKSQFSNDDFSEEEMSSSSQSEVSLIGDPIEKHKDFIMQRVRNFNCIPFFKLIGIDGSATKDTTVNQIFKEDTLFTFVGQLLTQLKRQSPATVDRFWQVFRQHQNFRRFLHFIYHTFPMQIVMGLLPKTLIYWQLNLPYEKLVLEEGEALELGRRIGFIDYDTQLRIPWVAALAPEQKAILLKENVQLATTVVFVLHEFYYSPFLKEEDRTNNEMEGKEEEGFLVKMGCEGRKRVKPNSE